MKGFFDLVSGFFALALGLVVAFGSFLIVYAFGNAVRAFFVAVALSVVGPMLGFPVLSYLQIMAATFMLDMCGLTQGVSNASSNTTGLINNAAERVQKISGSKG